VLTAATAGVLLRVMTMAQGIAAPAASTACLENVLQTLGGVCAGDIHRRCMHWRQLRECLAGRTHLAAAVQRLAQSKAADNTLLAAAPCWRACAGSSRLFPLLMVAHTRLGIAFGSDGRCKLTPDSGIGWAAMGGTDQKIGRGGGAAHQACVAQIEARVVGGDTISCTIGL
jgi:hypothetical protein